MFFIGYSYMFAAATLILQYFSVKLNFNFTEFSGIRRSGTIFSFDRSGLVLACTVLHPAKRPLLVTFLLPDKEVSHECLMSTIPPHIFVVGRKCAPRTDPSFNYSIFS
jgi:hypothetical protein